MRNLQFFTGQCFLFFVAGMETVSTALGVLLYELAINHDIQDKLYKELVACHPTEEVTFDELSKSKYLDNVMMEGLRRYIKRKKSCKASIADDR